jgi:hypothetical protein
VRRVSLQLAAAVRLTVASTEVTVKSATVARNRNTFVAQCIPAARTSYDRTLGQRSDGGVMGSMTEQLEGSTSDPQNCPATVPKTEPHIADYYFWLQIIHPFARQAEARGFVSISIQEVRTLAGRRTRRIAATDSHNPQLWISEILIF